MTGPLEGEKGQIRVELVVDTDKVDREVREGMEKAGIEADAEAKVIGEKIGHSLSEGTGTGFKKDGEKLVKTLEGELAGHEIPVRPRFKYFRDPHSGQILRQRVFEDIKDDVEGALEDVFQEISRPGGPLSKIGRGVGDAIGSVFNVSGKSPLIAVLIPVFGAIANAVVGLIAALQVLEGLLFVLPGLLVAIGIQGLILYDVFHGLTTAISAAFSANTPKELNKALAGTNYYVAQFIRGILPLKQIFKDLQQIAQDRFFIALGDGVARIAKLLDSPVFKHGFGDVAESLGKLFRSFFLVLASPSFKQLVDSLLGATSDWLKDFTPKLVDFLQGLIDVSNRLLPLLNYFGMAAGSFLDSIGQWLTIFANDPKTQKFIDQTEDLVNSLFALATTTMQTIFNLIDGINKAGGKKAIDSLTEGLQHFSDILASPEGQEGLAIWIQGFIMLNDLFWGMVEVLLIAPVAVEYFLKFVGDMIDWVITKFEEFITWIRRLVDGTHSSVKKIRDEFSGLRDFVIASFADSGTLLAEAGINLIKGFVGGIRQEAARSLGNVLNDVLGEVAKYIPHSPAKKGPFSGKGWTYYSGQAMVKDMARGMSDASSSLTNVTSSTMGNINFGPGAIRVGSDVAQTPTEARSAGSAVGLGIVGLLTSRNMQQAIRTL